MRANIQLGEGVVLGTPGARGLGYLVILHKDGQKKMKDATGELVLTVPKYIQH